MHEPAYGDLINIHTHDSVTVEGLFAVENLMAHQNISTGDYAGACSVGAHPWFITEDNILDQLALVEEIAYSDSVVAVGETGYDRHRGAGEGLQKRAFEEQARIAGERGKPLIIHCVKGWDELWLSWRRMKPEVPWIIHGFNGSKEQAQQLVGGGMYLSLWVKAVLSGKLNGVIASLPSDRLFLETDGFDVDMATVYEKAAAAAGVKVATLKDTIYRNYMSLFSAG